MPFKSEAQRKYLWANEPEIARDWTDTYGSGIQAAHGGRIPFQDGGNWYDNVYPFNINPFIGVAEHFGQIQKDDPSTWLGGLSGKTLGILDERNKLQEQELKKLDQSKGGGGGAGGKGVIDTSNPQVMTAGFSWPFGGTTGLESNRPSGIDTPMMRTELESNRPSGIDTKATSGEWRLPDTDWGPVKPTEALPERGKIDMFLQKFGVPPMTQVSDADRTANKEFMAGQNPLGQKIDVDQQTGRMTSGDFEGKNVAGKSAWGSANFGEMAQKWMDDYGDVEYSQTVMGDMKRKKQARMKEAAAAHAQKLEADRQERIRNERAQASAANQMTQRRPGMGGSHMSRSVQQGGLGLTTGQAQAVSDANRAAGMGGWKLAQGGRIGYQEGNMVGAEIEGAEMEGAMMQSEEVIKELYDALIAQGLSPQEAMEKIKQIIASSQAQEPQSPMMGEEFPGQEFGRTPAAFGGIMDTYTGRRKYGLGSFIKKAVKKVKKLAGSKLGKIALMYAAGTYLGGTEAFGGTGYSGASPWKKFGKQLLNPLGESGIANLAKPGGWSMFQGAPTVTAANVGPVKTSYGSILTGKDALKAGDAVKKAGDWSKWILPASIGAGAYTAVAPVEGLEEVSDEWNTEKSDFDRYLASLEGSYRLPEDLGAAQGGRIGRQEGGIMDLGGMEKDYRNEGGFVPLGGEEKADDVPARLSRNEFVFTADAVRNAGGGDIDRGAEVMENVMKNLEGGGKISEESQGQGAQEMFETSERLSEVI